MKEENLAEYKKHYVLNDHCQTNHCSSEQISVNFLNYTFKKQKPNKKNHQFSI